MEVFFILVGAALSAFIGYVLGCTFNNNKVRAKFEPKLWAVLGFFFGFQGLLVGIIYGLLKILCYSKR